MRLFLDANVLFSAARDPDGRCAALLAVSALSRHRRHQLLVSPHAVEEARRNLVLKNPNAVARLAETLEALEAVPEAPPPLLDWASEQGLSLADAPILAAAVHAKATRLVTGDRRHFGPLLSRTLRGVKVQSPREALAELLAVRRRKT